MTLWLDAQLSPSLVLWLRSQFGIEAYAVRDLGLRDAVDIAIFEAARRADAVILTKDADFPALVERLGPPPRVLWLRCGNTSNARLRTLLEVTLLDALALLDLGESMVEISDPWTQLPTW